MNKRQKKKNKKRWETGTAKQRRYNKWLCKRYPFLIPRNDWTGEITWDKRYVYTLAEEFPRGWWKAFGLMLCEELREELIRCNYLRQFRLEQVKEKFGELRIYFNGIPRDCHVDNIINKYSVLSRNICITCGRPDVYVLNGGWISPECFDCFKKRWKKREKYSNQLPASEMEILQAFNKVICSNTNKMGEAYKYTRWLPNEKRETVEIDISDTANKIRARWRDGLH